MPNYTYRCQNCKNRFEVFLTYAEYDKAEVRCPKCGGEDVKRMINKVRIAKTEESRIESMLDPSALSGLEDDPKSLGRLMRKMGNELGEDMGPEFDDLVSRLEKGQDPEEIEKEIPGLGEALDTAGDFDDSF